MDISEILDRIEIIHPEIPQISDLRRSYIDKDISSIFRLVESDTTDLKSSFIDKNLHSIFRTIENDITNLDDIRKFTIDGNLHSLFRLVNDESLRKLLLEDNKWKLWEVVSRYTSSSFIEGVRRFETTNITYNEDSLSQGQLKSKKWLVDQLSKLDTDLGTVFICAGWYGILASILFDSGLAIDCIRSFDKDDTCHTYADDFNKLWVKDNWKFKATSKDIHDINYDIYNYTTMRTSGINRPQQHSPDTIINTSCEHIMNFNSWYSSIPQGKLLILQSNDYHAISDHVNCHSSLDEFSSSVPMTKVMYKGELPLSKYTRFMKIGIK